MRGLSHLVAVAVLLCLAGGAVGQDASPDAFPDEWFFSGSKRPQTLRDLEGKPAPEITVAEWQGNATTLEANRGKVIILDFWATWCGPCVAAIPKNIALVNKYKDEGLVFIGMHDAASGWDRAPAMIEAKGINYTVALDKTDPAATERKTGLATKAYKVQFWPTYVAIDRHGIIRAAGLVPGKIEEVVQALLAEPGPALTSKSNGAETGDWPDDWFYGGAKRSARLRATEGELAQALGVSSEWLGEFPPVDFAGQVTVVQFITPENPIAMMHLETLNGVAANLERQGAVFVAVCDVRADWQRMTTEAKNREVTVSIARDQPHDDDPAGRAAAAYGVSFPPTTVVIDRAGRVRVAGIRMDKLEAVVGKLMAERLDVPLQP